MATTDEATPLQALLAVYGALDQAAIRGGAGIEVIVERYLPGSTGPNVGWYDELLGFLSDGANRDSRSTKEPPAAPDLSDALTILQSHNEHVAPGAKPPLTAVQLSRMVYGIGALSRLPDDYLPQGWETQFARTLAVASPQRSAEPGYQTAPLSGRPPNGEKLLELLRRQFRSRDDFPELMEYAAQQRWVDSLVADVPLCEAKAKFVRGHLCVVLTTEFGSAEVSLDEVKNVMDPLNWPKCLPFFCSMDPEDKRTDGWRRVLEHVSTTCSIPGTPQMVTPLKYWNGQDTNQPQPSAWVNYALDVDPAPGEKGDGRMVVDDGFIRMTSTVKNSAQKGVRVRTQKVAGFRDLAFFPAALFACLVGYAIAGEDMVLIGVASRASDPAGWTDWNPTTSTGATGPTQPGQPAGGGDPGSRAVALAVDMLNDCIDDVSKKSAALAAQWTAGAMPVAETMSFTADLAARLATDPWRYLERLANPTQGGDK
jgi:hypothetical protein